MSNARKQLEKWLKTIDVKGSVLDVGGVSMPVKGRTKSWETTAYKILDYNRADYEYDINTFIDWMPQFDNVFCLEVMEYVWNPATAIQNMSRFLKPGGLLYISFHFLFPHHNPKHLDYLRYTGKGIEKLLSEASLKIREVVPKTTIVPDVLKEFCEAESKVYIRPGEIGYLIKAQK